MPKNSASVAVILSSNKQKKLDVMMFCSF